MKLDGSRDAGFLTPTTLVVIVVIVTAISAFSWVNKEPASDTIPLDLTITMSAINMNKLDILHCDLGNYDISIHAEHDPVTVNFPDIFYESPAGMCRYTIFADVPVSESYEFRFNIHPDDMVSFFDRQVTYDNMITTNVEGEPELATRITW